ncbi:MAG: ECF transporter S component [Coriobacteriia bacterium]|nr:ECF transporter S component [Coriobacteriia bacterium]MCL2745523.1 ECF transporter S component [Coriobacteriia bacterium]MCL2870851.1 ECF transporter S component [Coriobacteriia bacterium]
MNLLISSVVVGIPLIVLVFGIERVKPRPRDLMPVIVLTALAILGRVAAMPIPNFQPATALIILAGFFFGRHAGLLSGMLVALVSNIFMGQGPWTPWQMLTWGLVGYGAGLLGDRVSWAQPHEVEPREPEKNRYTKRRRIILLAVVIIYGVVASLLFGMIMDVQFFVAYIWESGWPGLVATWMMGLPMNVAHAASTCIFLVLTLIPWGKKFHRLKTKYGIRSI